MASPFFFIKQFNLIQKEEAAKPGKILKSFGTATAKTNDKPIEEETIKIQSKATPPPPTPPPTIQELKMDSPSLLAAPVQQPPPPQPPPSKPCAPPRTGDYDIPIFTEEFLDHNKTVDSELRLLRKSNTDYEQQNSVLEKHVENMTNGVQKVQDETSALQQQNAAMQTYLVKLRRKLATALSALSIPTEPTGASIENIDKYMRDLHSMSTSNSHGPASLNKAKDIVRKLDLHIS